MKFFALSSAAMTAMLLLCSCSDRDSADKKLNQAVKQARQGEWESVQKSASDLAVDYPKTSAPLLLQALAYEKSGDMFKAIDLATQCAKADPENFTVLYTLGRLYSQDAQRSAEAFTILEHALELKPDDRNTLILLCNLGVTRNEPNTGKYIDMLMKQSDRESFARIGYLKALFLGNNGKISEAVNYMFEAAKSSRDNPLLILNAARFIDLQGREYRIKARNLYMIFVSIYQRTASPAPELLQEAKIRIQKLAVR